jgi:glycosyltransferase involved in cell wall biosynthesis
MAILTTNNPGLVDLIKKYKFGYYIDEITTQKIKQAINFIVENQLWNNITNEIKYELSWDKHKNLFLNAIKDLSIS